MEEKSKIVKAMSIVAILEGLSYLFLIFVSMPLKYVLGMGLPNKIGGYFHGALFILYIALIFPTAKKLLWSNKTIIIAGLMSVVPFGTFWIDKKYLK